MNEAGIHKSALLLLALGDAAAREVMAYLSPGEAQRIGSAVSAIGAISLHEKERVLREFEARCAGRASTITPSDAIGSKAVPSFSDDSRIDTATEAPFENEAVGIAQFAKVPALQAARVIEKEHPQAIVAILGRLAHSHARAIMDYFPPPLRAEVMRRKESLKPVQPDALDEIDAALAEILLSRNTVATDFVPDADLFASTEQRTAELLNQVRDDAGGMLAQVEELTAFRQIAELDRPSLRRLLDEIPRESLLIALKGADDELLKKIVAVMDSAAAQQLCDALAVRGPVGVGAIEVEQQAMLRLATRIATTCATVRD